MKPKEIDSPARQGTWKRQTSRLWLLLVGSLALTNAQECCAAESSGAPVRGTDELFWVPTLGQALDMAAATGKPIFLMGYSLVGDGSTYTKLDAAYCQGVF